MSLTKQDIDALVAGLPSGYWPLAALRTHLYLAAGLTAEGERKPERVRAWIHEMNGERTIQLTAPQGGFIHGPQHGCRLIPGWFVPDGAE